MLLELPYFGHSEPTRRRETDDRPQKYVGIYSGTNQGCPAIFAIDLGVFEKAGLAREHSERVTPAGLDNAQPLSVVPQNTIEKELARMETTILGRLSDDPERLPRRRNPLRNQSPCFSQGSVAGFRTPKLTGDSGG
jgi:hypothetical protein